MTRLSSYFLPTLKEPPADAEAISHVLMVRAGLVRQLGAGMWTYLPAGWRVHRRVEQILREEMDAIGALEMLDAGAPAARSCGGAPAAAEIPELFKLRDRNERPLVLAMTHEEAVTYHVSRDVRSYRDLPLILYHFQIKERDEPRPRAGRAAHARVHHEGLLQLRPRRGGPRRAPTQRHIEAYDRIFDRCGLRWYRVESDVGMMGGLGAHEYMAPCAAGENEVALSDAGYAANVEVATGTPPEPAFPPPLDAPEPVETPDARTIEEVSRLLGVDPADADQVAAGRERRTARCALALVRGDHTPERDQAPERARRRSSARRPRRRSARRSAPSRASSGRSASTSR